MSRELLFSLGKKDFELQVFRAGGKGGQKQNKTSSACRIIHTASGAVGESREERSQLQNKKNAFERCTKHPKFKVWMAQKVYESRTKITTEEKVNRMMQPQNLKVEGIDENGEWVTIPF